MHALVIDQARRRRQPHSGSNGSRLTVQCPQLHRGCSTPPTITPPRTDRPQPPSLELRPQQPCGGDHAQVQQPPAWRPAPRNASRIQDARRQRHQRHAADVREHQPGHHHRGLLAVGQLRPEAIAQTTRGAPITPRATPPPAPTAARWPPHRSASASPSPSVARNSQDQHEGLRERPSAKEPPGRFGMRADLKASVAALAEEAALLAHQPVMREASVSDRTTEAERSRLMA